MSGYEAGAAAFSIGVVTALFIVGTVKLEGFIRRWRR